MVDNKRKNNFLNDILNKKLPFSFEYNGCVSQNFLDNWEYDCQKSVCDKGIKYNISYTDKETELKYIIEVTEYEKDGALSWKTYFENTGKENSGQISGIKVLDTVFKDMENSTLHSCYGSNCQADDFRPITEFLSKIPFVLHTNLGRSTNYHAPYFNIRSQKSEQTDTSGLVNAPMGKFVKEWTDGEGEGIIGALGWSGQWMGEFSSDGSCAKCFMGLDDYVNFYLKPGEKVHVPSMYLVFSQGTFEDNQNDFRKFLTDYIIPRDKNGEIIKAPLMVSGWGGMRTSEYEKRLEKITEHKLPYEYYWMDAGWYGDEECYDDSEATSKWALNVGNWQVNKFRHPNGLRYLSDKFAQAGLKYLLWIEIERAISGTPSELEHPEYWIGERGENRNLCLNMADDRACDWAIETVGKIIEENNVKCWREDYNFDSLPFWQEQDEEKRDGITEIKAVNNGYRMWDTLIEKYGIIIDNCASGGRRLDISMAKRSFSFWRTDYQCFQNYDPIAPQLATSWFAPWNINHCCGVDYWPGDTFRFRASVANGICFHFCPGENWPIPDDYPYEWHKKMMEDFLLVRDCFYGNYYSLLKSEFDHKIWISYEFYREDLGKGCIFVFRESESDIKVCDILPKGLEKDAVYKVVSLDTEENFEIKGAELMEKGIEVSIGNRLESRLYYFEII